MVKRILSPACLAGLLLLGGCLENVEPDQDGKGTTGTPVDAVVVVPFLGSPALRLTLRQLSGRTTLSVTNPGLGTVDSAAYLIHLYTGMEWPTYLYQSSIPYAWEYYGRVGRLAPGASVTVGVIDSAWVPGLPTKHGFSAALIRYSEDGVDRGNPRAGVFRGRFRIVDTAGKIESGGAEGMIDAGGTIGMSLRYSSSSLYMGDTFTGTLDEGGKPEKGFILMHYNTWWHAGNEDAFALAPLDRGYRLDLAVSDSALWLDSLEVTLDPYTPR